MEFLIEEIDDLPINDDPVISEEIKMDIIINNITSSFTVGCEIDYEKIPAKYITKSDKSIIAKFKIDDCTIVMRNSGKFLSMGASSDDQARSAAKKCVEILRSWGLEANFKHYKVFNILCTCRMPWRIQIEAMVRKYRHFFIYESKIRKCCALKINKKKGYLGVYATGSVRIVGHTIEMVVNILEKALPFLAEFRI